MGRLMDRMASFEADEANNRARRALDGQDIIDTEIASIKAILVDFDKRLKALEKKGE